MKKCILSAIAGGLAVLVAIAVVANIRVNDAQAPKEYVHSDYVSGITQAECFVCGNGSEPFYWGEDNVGLVNLNTFELMPIEINRYGDDGELVEEVAGYMQTCHLADKEAGTYAHAYVFPDRAYSSVQITGVQHAIDREAVQSHLCQGCIASFNKAWLADIPPAEYAIVSFDDRTIQPLWNTYSWFSAGNYGIACAFQEDGRIDLLIHYCPMRYE